MLVRRPRVMGDGWTWKGQKISDIWLISHFSAGVLGLMSGVRIMHDHHDAAQGRSRMRQHPHAVIVQKLS